MQFSDFKKVLDADPNAKLQFVLGNGDAVAPHFHVTEVGVIDKQFIDCGGQRRSVQTCQLQLWVADDVEHRLNAGKLSGILALAGPLLNDRDLEIEVEYGPEVAAVYTISSAMSIFGTLKFNLAGKQTDCLAKDKCGVGANACC